MGKRGRENPCAVCSHYHKYEEGEACGICGHRLALAAEKTVSQPAVFPSEILPNFLYLGTYDNASHITILKLEGISHILNTVADSKNLYKNCFTYHRLDNNLNIPFDDAVKFLEKCEKDGARVLVHCMSGKSRSPAVVVAYLMKTKGWRLGQSYKWVKDRRPFVDISPVVYQQLMDYEQTIFENENSPSLPGTVSSSAESILKDALQELSVGTTETRSTSVAHLAVNPPNVCTDGA